MILAAIHSRDPWLPPGVDPFDPAFRVETAVEIVEQHTRRGLDFLRRAGEEGADLACTHEDFRGTSLFLRCLDRPELLTSLAEEIPGPTSEALAGVARRYHMNIAANYYERLGQSIHNTSVLFDRQGRMVGRYRKAHLPASERWRLEAGTDFPVFPTDVGAVGFATCYDLLFPEHCRSVALNGADIIVHQTQGWGMVSNDLGEALVRVRAAENTVCLVVAKNIQAGDGGYSCVVDNRGQIVARAAGDEETIVRAELEPDFDLVDPTSYNALFSGVDSFRARQALERVPGFYATLTRDRPALLDRYPGARLAVGPESVRAVYGTWRRHVEETKRQRVPGARYHW